MLQLGVFGFLDHLVRAGEIFFDLLELAMFLDDFIQFGVLLGDFLELRRVGDQLGGGELASEFVVAGAELVQFFGKSDYSHK